MLTADGKREMTAAEEAECKRRQRKVMREAAEARRREKIARMRRQESADLLARLMRSAGCPPEDIVRAVERALDDPDEPWVAARGRERALEELEHARAQGAGERALFTRGSRTRGRFN